MKAQGMVSALRVRVEGLVDGFFKLLHPKGEVLLFVFVREGFDVEAFAGCSLIPFTVHGVAIVIVIYFGRCVVYTSLSELSCSQPASI